MKPTPFLSLLTACLLATSVAQARVTDQGTSDRGASSQSQGDAAAYLAEIAQTLEKARAGDLGTLSTAELDALERSQRRINRLLRGHDNISELNRRDRIALYNVQELMLAIIRKRPYEQNMCRSSSANYTRVRQYECASWEKRQARRRDARTTTRVLQFGQYEGQ